MGDKGAGYALFMLLFANFRSQTWYYDWAYLH